MFGHDTWVARARIKNCSTGSSQNVYQEYSFYCGRLLVSSMFHGAGPFLKSWEFHSVNKCATSTERVLRCLPLGNCLEPVHSRSCPISQTLKQGLLPTPGLSSGLVSRRFPTKILSAVLNITNAINRTAYPILLDWIADNISTNFRVLSVTISIKYYCYLFI
jgi:hypothetical protein